MDSTTWINGCLLVAMAWPGALLAATPPLATRSASATSQPAVAPSGVWSPGSQNPARTSSSKDLEDIDLFSLEVPTVVTASRREQKVHNLPYAVSVITAEDIRLAGARNVPDALRLAPGVDVADLGVNASAVSIRGSHGFLARSVLVLVDGRQIFDSLFGGTLWGGWPFELEDIERIEVVRGPGGVIWGANAVNGVINIITKDPKDQLGLTVTGGGGSRGANKEHAGYAFADGKLRMRVSGEFESSDGFLKGGSLLRGLEDDQKASRGTVHAIFDATPRDRITLSGGSAVVDGGLSATPLGTFFDHRPAQTMGSYMQGKWAHEIAADNRIELNAYVNDFGGCPAANQIDYRYQQLALQLSHTFQPAENHTLTWGIDGRTDLLNASNSDPYLLTRDFLSTAIIGLYAQDEWRFAPRWAFTLGGRIDYEFYGGFQPSARASLSYDLTETSAVYGAVSRAFQMPPVGMRFLNVPVAEGLANFTTDRDVRPETLVAYEIGYRGRFFDRLQTNVNVYCHDYRDLTAFHTLLGPPGLIQSRIENGYSAYTYGLETDVRYAVTPKLTLLANYTFESPEESGPFSLAQTDFISPPKHKFMLGARYTPLDRLHLSAHLYYVDAVKAPNPEFPLLRRQIPQYFRFDLRAEYEFWKDRGSVAVGVRNLLDDNHPEGTTQFLNNAEVPRMVYAEMRLTFK